MAARPSPDTVYVDTNVFVHHLHPSQAVPRDQEFSRRTLAFFQDVEDGKYKAVTSTFTLTECRGVLKRVISKQYATGATLPQVQRAMDKLDGFLNLMGIALFDADKLTGSLYNPIFSECNNIVSGAGAVSTNKGWRSLGGADGITTALAQRCGARYVVTFDVGFKGLGWTVAPFILWDKYQ